MKHIIKVRVIRDVKTRTAKSMFDTPTPPKKVK